MQQPCTLAKEKENSTLLPISYISNIIEANYPRFVQEFRDREKEVSDSTPQPTSSTKMSGEPRLRP